MSTSYVGKDEIEVGKMVNCPSCKARLLLESCIRCEFHGGFHEEPIIQIENKQRKIIGTDTRVMCNIPRLVQIETINKAPEDSKELKAPKIK